MAAGGKSVTDNIFSKEPEDEDEIFNELKNACVDEVREQIHAAGTKEADIQTDEPVRFKPGAASFKAVYEKLPNRLSATTAAKLTPAAVFYVLLHASQECNFQFTQVDKENFLIHEEVVDESSRKTN